MEHERGRRRGTGCWGRRPGEKREATTPQRKFKGLVGYIRVRLTLPSALCPAEIFFFFFFFLTLVCVLQNPRSLTRGSNLHRCSEHVES